MAHLKKSAAVLVEPGYEKLLYGDYCLRGIRGMAEKKDVAVKYFSPFNPAEGYPEKLPLYTILLSATDAWAASVSAQLHRRGCEVIHLPCSQSATDPRNHTIGENFTGYTEAMYRYLAEGGRRRIGLIGFKNGALDRLRVEALMRVHAAEGSADELTLLPPDQDFADIPGRFDAVIVNNGTNAAVFVMWANTNGVRIPEDLWVMTTQATQITRIISPSITAVAGFDYFLAGELAVQMLFMLSSLEMPGQIHLLQNYKLIPRDSTGCFTPGERTADAPSYRVTPQKWMRKSDYSTCLCYEIEDKLFYLDETDLEILRQVLRRTTTEHIAEIVNMSISAVNYRTRSILSLFHMDSRHAMVKLFAENNLLGIQ